jgi:hypothetical protein
VRVCLAGVPQVDDLAFDADGRLFAPVAGDDRPVQDHVRGSLLAGPFQRVGQVRGLSGQHGDDLAEVAVGAGPRYPVVTGQRIRAGAVAEPPQPQHRLPKAGQRPAAAGCAASAALRQQQLRNEPGQFPRHVKRGTIADHVEPSGEEDLVVRPLLLGLHAPFRAARFVRESALMCMPGLDKARLSEPISLRSPQCSWCQIRQS